MPERVVLITGATDGLGRGLAVACGRQGFTVLVHGRSAQRIADTVAEVEATGATVRSYQADLSSLSEVGRLCDELLANESRLDVLCSNAGIGANLPSPAREESADGIELRLAVNYLAGYVLVERLLPLLEASRPARIVLVSSAGQQALDFDDLQLTRDYSGVRAYCQSKLAQILQAYDLAERLPPDITATALHPATYMPTKMVPSPISTLQEGIDATMQLIASPAVEGVTGAYFRGLAQSDPDPQALDSSARTALRDWSTVVTRGQVS